MVAQPTDDLLASIALVRFAVEYEDSHPALAARAWDTAAERTARWGLRPVDAVALL